MKSEQLLPDESLCLVEPISIDVQLPQDARQQARADVFARRNE